MKEFLQKKYRNLQELCKLNVSGGTELNTIIKKLICEFLDKCNRPAIWCYGRHTKMLMADFMFEMKMVHFIIDNGVKNIFDGGFEVINKDSIREKGIDGIIISSWVYKDEIKMELKANYKDICYLDIYEELEKIGIHLDSCYYAKCHPYSRYADLNQRQRIFLQNRDVEILQTELKKIINIYIDIKDFKSAIKYAKKLLELSNKTWEKLLIEQLKEIYRLQLDVLRKIDDNNVIMLCLDGLRRKDILEKKIKKLY